MQEINRTRRYNMKKEEAIEIGRKAVAIIEAVCVPNLDGEALYFCQLHRRCQDWFDHPDWPEYMIYIKRIIETVENYC